MAWPLLQRLHVTFKHRGSPFWLTPRLFSPFFWLGTRGAGGSDYPLGGCCCKAPQPLVCLLSLQIASQPGLQRQFSESVPSGGTGVVSSSPTAQFHQPAYFWWLCDDSSPWEALLSAVLKCLFCTLYFPFFVSPDFQRYPFPVGSGPSSLSWQSHSSSLVIAYFSVTFTTFLHRTSTSNHHFHSLSPSLCYVTCSVLSPA